MKVFIVSGNHQYVDLWEKFGHTVVDSAQEADIIQFTGGEDVSPHLYKEKPHPYTHSNPVRDVVEEAVFNLAVEKEIPVVGICRGAQFLNVMNGGKLYQHVSKHTSAHPILDITSGRKILASSTHHQMMRPTSSAELVAVADERGYQESVRKDGVVERIEHHRDGEEDAEAVFYPLTRSLCFQPHPEFPNREYQPLQEYYFELIDSLIFGES